MDALQQVIATQGGLLLLLLLSPTIFVGGLAVLYFKSLRPAVPVPMPVPPIDYDALSSMRKEQRLMASHIHKLGERLARVEAKQEERNKG